MRIAPPLAAMYGSDRTGVAEAQVTLAAARQAAQDILRGDSVDQEALRLALRAARRIRERRVLVRQTALEQIAGMAGFTMDEVRGPHRGRDIVDVRRAIVAFLRSLDPSVSWPEIGRILNRDHTTAMHLLRPTASHRPRQQRGAA